MLRIEIPVDASLHTPLYNTKCRIGNKQFYYFCCVIDIFRRNADQPITKHTRFQPGVLCYVKNQGSYSFSGT